ncbi:MAG: hypothetical protein A3E84_04905 [Gammaproteobacteria bacterium RIFCSPHIGHO2_12_FULL_42_13]|nr:MAG: hypothetical protein A3E84_04905 [Gammaproteobacteria bacterium RIFCSPHIGHO2_12_FULL_42_13]
MGYVHHFGDRPENYLSFRPDYPQALFSYLAKTAKNNNTAWDCATGNGQAASALSPYFKQVIATDINQAQLDVAPKKKNISYHVWPAEHTQIENSSVDLVTIAQALHWFDFSMFYDEVRRVATADGIIAAWCYSLCTVNPAIDTVIKKLYFEILGETYLPKEAKFIRDEYKTIPFPFMKQQVPVFSIEKDINFKQLIGYFQTWSAVKEYQNRLLKNPLDLIVSDLKKAWGNTNENQHISWPIHLLVGRVHELK